MLQQLGYVNDKNEPEPWKRPDQNDQKNLQIIFSRPKPSDELSADRVTKDFKRTVELLPALAMEYVRAASRCLRWSVCIPIH